MRKPLWVPPSSAAKRNAGHAGDPTLDPLGDKGVGIHPLWQEGHDEKPALGTVKAHIGMEFLFHLARASGRTCAGRGRQVLSMWPL